MSRSETRMTPSLALAAAWIVVAIPLVWGVYQTVKKSIPLFQPAAAAAPAAHR